MTVEPEWSNLNPDVPGMGAKGQGLFEALGVLVLGWVIARLVIFTFDLDSAIATLGNQIRVLLGWQARDEAAV